MPKKLLAALFPPKDPFAPRLAGVYRIGRALLVALVVLVTVRLVWGCSSTAHLNRALDRVHQAHLPLAMREVPLPEVPEDQDAWPLYAELLRAADQRGVGMAPLLEDQARRQPLSEADKARLEVGRADEMLLKNWQPGDPMDATIKQQMTERLKGNQDLLDSLAQAARKGSIRWRVTDDPARPLEVNTLPLITLARLMLARAAIAFDENRPADGLEDLGVVYRVAYQIRQCPMVEMHLMEAMLVLESSAALQRALPHIDAAREKFARLIADCQGGPIAGPLRTATEFTIAWLNGTYLSLMAGGRGVGPAIEVFALRPLIDASYARVWELLADLVPMIDGTYAHFIVPVEQRCQAAGGGATGEWLRANMQRELSAAHAAAVSEALRGMSQLALAARSWQLAHGGSLPDSLDVLAGDLLPAVPADPMTDQPLQYVRGGEAPRFYSVGLDRKDNQGSCDRKDDILGQKDHDICFSLTGLPANPITASRPASEPASAAATGPASAPDPAASAPAAAASAPASRPS